MLCGLLKLLKWYGKLTKKEKYICSKIPEFYLFGIMHFHFVFLLGLLPLKHGKFFFLGNINMESVVSLLYKVKGNLL